VQTEDSLEREVSPRPINTFRDLLSPTFKSFILKNL
jgi:hypothetical protein